MKLITLSGGLGNQMFQFAFSLALHKEDKFVYLYINKILRYNEHNGYELQRLFDIEKNMKNKWMTKVLQNKFFDLTFRHILFPVKIRERKLYDFSEYSKWIGYKDPIGIRLVGYWQSEKYFESVADDVRSVFTFPLDKLNNKTLSLIDEIKGNQAVSLHVRRGDYVTTSFGDKYGGLCDEAYYQNAIDYITSRVDNIHIYVFSDDMEWVKNSLKLPESSTFVDWNCGKDSWQDMFLMSMCKHNIIANSSFSWWGAWLNKNINKICIAPKTWARGIDCPDVTPLNWIRL